MKPLCIYHSGCSDGFTAAWVVSKYFKDRGGCDFYPGVYQEAPPDITGRPIVLLVDFSYSKSVIEEMCQKASVTIYDHHKSAIEDLKNLKLIPLNTHFDLNKSGARIVWDILFPDEKPPQFLLHVEDRDLWKFALEGTREIMAAIFSYEYDFKVWDHLEEVLESGVLMIQGSAILRYQQKNIKEVLAKATRRMKIGGHEIPIVNIPYSWGSGAVPLLGKGLPFAGYYFDSADRREFG